MSWNPFKKAFSGRRTRTEDIDFEREVNKLRQMQAVSKRMYKDMQKCNEAETALTRAGQKVVLDIKTSPLGRTDPLKSTAEVLGGITDDMHGHCKTLRYNQEVTFTEPIKKFNNVYKHVEFHARQRELKLQEYEKQQAKLEKVGRKSSTQPPPPGTQVKLELTQRAVASTKADYSRVHSRMMQEMPVLYEGRVDYFDHCLQAVIKAQALYYHECSETLLAGLSKLQNGSCDLRSEEDISRTTEKHLADIRALSIVGSAPGL